MLYSFIVVLVCVSTYMCVKCIYMYVKRTYREKKKKKPKRQTEGLEEPHSPGTNCWMEAANRHSTGWLVFFFWGLLRPCTVCVGMSQ